MLKKSFVKLLAFFLIAFCARQAAAVELPDFTELVEKQGAAVVNISATQIVHANPELQGFPNLPKNDPFYEFFRRFQPQVPQDRETQSLGSGFIISSDGYIMTNAHVVNGADGITVRLTDKREFKAKVIGLDMRTDVALIKIDASGLPKVTQGDPNALKVGEWVLAIGSPFGFDNSVTAGIVSAKGRSLSQENYVPFIQTDAAINPGNSCGPLFNMKGEVIGINSQIYSRSGGYMGLSFAIPIDVAMDVADQLRSTGKVSRGRIGITIQEVTRELAESFKLKSTAGAVISNVEKGGPADKAGIQVSDIVIEFAGKPVATSADLPRIVAATHPGTQVPVKLWRKVEIKEISVVVSEMPMDPQPQAKAESAPAGGESVSRLGLTLSELTAEQKDELKIKGGVVVDEVKGFAARVLEEGTVILAINNAEISTVAQFNEELKKIPKGQRIALLVRNGDVTSYVTLKLDEK
ncbi:MAG: DegQ family serine endoprotease [Gallionellaceae bacterium]|jgi:serine protease Do|nr:DegQ family serine endoprotease [Gallionellaceae bacterium]